MTSHPTRCILIDTDAPGLSVIENAEHTDPWPETAFLRCFNACFLGWGVKIDDTLVGYLIVDVRCSDWHILNLTIAHAHQQRGYARFLLTELVRFFVEQKAERIHLEVRASNARAIFLYESLGFIAVGKRKKYYPVVHSLPAEDAILYTYRNPFTLRGEADCSAE